MHLKSRSFWLLMRYSKLILVREFNTAVITSCQAIDF